MLGQMLDGVERFLSDIVTFKSQVTSYCETDPQVFDWVPQHHYLRLAITELKDPEIKRAFSFIVIARDCSLVCWDFVTLWRSSRTLYEKW